MDAPRALILVSSVLQQAKKLHLHGPEHQFLDGDGGWIGSSDGRKNKCLQDFHE
jgi:hypothetical protein